MSTSTPPSMRRTRLTWDDTSTPEAESTEPTAEELERIHTRNAFVRALDALLTDIRQRSYEGKITTTARWKKAFVPT